MSPRLSEIRFLLSAATVKLSEGPTSLAPRLCDGQKNLVLGAARSCCRSSGLSANPLVRCFSAAAVARGDDDDGEVIHADEKYYLTCVLAAILSIVGASSTTTMDRAVG